jgi:hypothetical protein
MPAPIIGAAAIAASRILAREVAKRAGKKAVKTVVKSAGGKRVYTRATSPTRNVRNPVPNKKRPLPERMKKTTTGQGRKKVSDKVARAIAVESAGKKAGAPFGRIRTTAKPNSGRGLSRSEKERDVFYKSKKNPVVKEQGKPKRVERKTQAQKDAERRYEIRQAMKGGKGGQRAPKPEPTKPGRTLSEVLEPLKGKKVKLDTEVKIVNGKIVKRPIRVDAEEYVVTRALTRSAGKNPQNSVAPRTRAQEKSRADAAEARAIREARREEVTQRLRDIKDTEASKANPRRYSSPTQERGNVRQTEGLIAQGEKRIQQETARRRVEQEKIARTPKRRKEVEATLQKVKDREAARRSTQRVKDTDAARLKVKPNRKRRSR